MPLVIIAIGVVLLLIMIMGLKLNTFVSLIIVSFIVGLALGIPLEDVVHSVEAGLGGTLGHIALIFGLGAMLGRLIADAGGAHRIAITLINKFGEKRIEWAVVTASFIVGIALFFEVALRIINSYCILYCKRTKNANCKIRTSNGCGYFSDTRFLTANCTINTFTNNVSTPIGEVIPERFEPSFELHLF